MKEYIPLYKFNGIWRNIPSPVIPCQPLFDPEEEDKAQTILKTLDGLSSVQAQNLLEKCKMAILQCEIKVNLD